MKKCLAIITAAAMLALCCGCSNEENTVSDQKSSEASASSEEAGSKESREIITSISSPELPLHTEEWGKAAKYSADKSKYYDVPIRIVRIISGDEAAKAVKKFTASDKTYTYKAPEKGSKWVMAEYEICLDGFPAGKGGADASISSFITAADGGTIEYKNRKYAVPTINITDGGYYFEGTQKGSIAYIMPEGFTDYIITTGEYGEDQAFFTPVPA